MPALALAAASNVVFRKTSSFNRPLAPVFLAAFSAYQYTARTQKRWTKKAPAPNSLSLGTNICTSSLPLMTRTTSSLSTETILLKTSFLGGDHAKPQLNRRHRTQRAYMDPAFRVPYPEASAESPEWWWRTLSCVPYLMALQISDVAFYFQPLMERYEQFEFLSYYIPGAIRRLPSWFLMVYCFAVYVEVVRNRQWPHFFRYHVMMGLLLENVVQIFWYSSNFMPLIHYSGKFAMPYWAMVGTLYISALLFCVSCAIGGLYVNFPFINDAAYVHTPYVKGDQ